MTGSLHPLVRILADGRFHSGTHLGNALGISRAAIWKHIDKIAELGLEVHSVRGKGYRLVQALDLLDQERIAGELQGNANRIQHLEILTSVDSTNSHAMRLVQDGTLVPESGRYAVVMAERQTSGKGRRGRQWISPFGQNLYLTMVREVDAGVMKTDGISLAVGLALVRSLQAFGIGDIGVKWPNDVLWQGKKLAGILLEITGDITGVCQLLVGVGVNLHCRPGDMAAVSQPWTDLHEISGSAIDRNMLAAGVISHIMAALGEFEDSGLAGFMQEWQAHDVMKDREVELVTAAGSRFGRARGITESGALLLDTGHEVEAVIGGEISLRGVVGR